MGSARRALDDLAEGMRSLLGGSASRPRLVDELLGERRRTPPRGSAAPRGRARRVRAGTSRLVRVK